MIRLTPCPRIRADWVRHAILGMILWSIGQLFFGMEWSSALLTLAPLVIVPLGLALRDDLEVGFSLRWLPPLQLLAALAFLTAFIHYPGPTAFLWALPWMVVTLLFALLSLWVLWRRGWQPLATLPGVASGLFLVIGAGWALLSRGGIRPMGFGEPIAQLTGVHFHYAGFALSLITGLVGARMGGQSSSWVAIAVLLGIPGVALGISVAHVAPLVEALAAVLLSGAGLAVGIQQIRVAFRVKGIIERILLFGAALSLITGMGFAVVFALGTYGRWYGLSILDMIRWHGTLNALGFSLGGLVAWNLLALRGAEVRVVLANREGQPHLEELEKRGLWAGIEHGPTLGDNQDTYERVLGVDPPGPPEKGHLFDRVRREIMAYEIFPRSWVTGILRRAPVETGDTIGIRYHAILGLDLIFGARVVETFDGPVQGVWRSGFTYQTLAGHPEYGTETFSVEKDLATGQVTMALRSWSRPGTLLTWLAKPFVRLQQKRASAAALQGKAKSVVPQETPCTNIP